MIRSLALIIFLFLSQPSLALDKFSDATAARVIEEMNSKLPRRLDYGSVMTRTFYKNKTWYMNVVMTLNGVEFNSVAQNAVRDYQNKNHCKPSKRLLDEGVTIITQFFDENERFLFMAVTDSSACNH